MAPPMDANATSDISTRSCLAMALGGLAFLALALGLLVWAIIVEGDREHKEFEKRQTARRQAYVAEVKAGGDGSRISVDSPLLVEMLANDPGCIANLTTLNFSMAELDDPRIASIKKLTNLKSLGFYCCPGMDSLALAIEGMPSIEKIWCEGERFTPAGVKSLAKLPNLRRVEFTWHVEPEYEEMLRSTLPGVEIISPLPEDE